MSKDSLFILQYFTLVIYFHCFSLFPPNSLLCMFSCLYMQVHMHVYSYVHRGRDKPQVSFLRHLTPWYNIVIWFVLETVSLANMQLMDSAALADQWAAGFYLSLPPTCWDCKRMPWAMSHVDSEGQQALDDPSYQSLKQCFKMDFISSSLVISRLFCHVLFQR